MATYWAPDLPDIKGFLWHSILKLANGNSSVWSNKHIKMLGWVQGLVKYFLSWKSLKHWNQARGDWKRVSCHGNYRFVVCITISLPSFSGHYCKLNELALLFLSTWCNIELSARHHQSSHLHIFHIFQTWNISGVHQLCRYLQTVNGVFKSFVEF